MQAIDFIEIPSGTYIALIVSENKRETDVRSLMVLMSKEKNKDIAFKEKRSFKRISTNIDARFFYGNIFYSGVVSDISEGGMFINTKHCLNNDSMFVVIIRDNNDLLKVIAKVKRTSRQSETCNGMRVELMSPSMSYKDYIDKLKVNS